MLDTLFKINPLLIIIFPLCVIIILYKYYGVSLTLDDSDILKVFNDIDVPILSEITHLLPSHIESSPILHQFCGGVLNSSKFVGTPLLYSVDISDGVSV